VLAALLAARTSHDPATYAAVDAEAVLASGASGYPYLSGVAVRGDRRDHRSCRE
jgi:hypothetical protein